MPVNELYVTASHKCITYLRGVFGFVRLIRIPARGLGFSLAPEESCCMGGAVLPLEPSSGRVFDNTSFIFLTGLLDCVVGCCLCGRDKLRDIMSRSSSLLMSLGILCITSGFLVGKDALGTLTRSADGWAGGEPATSRIGHYMQMRPEQPLYPTTAS